MTAKPTAQAVLRQHALFRDLQPAALERVAATAQRQSARRNALVFSQGDPGDALYGVIAGKVHIVSTASDGREVLLNIMDPGDTFGEIALLDGGPRTASARAMAPTELFVITRQSFRTLLAADADLVLHLFGILCQRLRRSTEILEDNVFLGVPARLAKRLVALHRQSGKGAEIEISQDELAHLLGVSRQVVNQTLTAWRRSGWVAIRRGRLALLAPERLEALVAQPRG
jgi:CRP-like cAMP-binding protein